MDTNHIKLATLSLLLAFQIHLFGQQPSFQVRLDNPQENGFFQKIMVNEFDEISLMMIEFNPIRIKSIPVNGQIGSVQAKEFRYLSPIQQTLFTVLDAYYHSNSIYFSKLTLSGPILSSVNLLSGETWSKEIEGGYASLTSDTEGNALIVNASASNLPTSNPYLIERVVEVFKFDTTGNLLLKKALVLNKLGLPYIDGIVRITDSKSDKYNNLYFIGNFIVKDSIAGNFSKLGPQFIIKLNSLGTPIKWRIISDHPFYELNITDDNVYLLDKPSDSYNIATLDVDKGAARLLKLDHDLNFQWGKTYYGENFNYLTASIVQMPSGKLVMAHTTFGAFPVILTELDPLGNIISQKGYPNYEPLLKVMSDGSLLLCSTTDSTGSVSQHPIIAKTDALGNIAGCPNFPTCLFAEDFTIAFDSFQISTVEAVEPNTTLGLVESTTASFSPYCNYPPVPNPDFNFPDTLCLGDSAATSNTFNRLAQAREWHLTGPNTDSLLRDSFDFSYTFTQPGEYQLQQTVWVLGCSYIAEQSITVLPSLEVAISPELICPDESQVLEITSNRPLESYLWGNGSMASTLEIQTSGAYSVTASDGHCEATDMADIVVVSDLLNGQPAFTLPPDTTICDRDLPFVLIPQSAFTDTFYFENGAVQAVSFPLPSAGSYKVGMKAFGCNIEKSYHLLVDCHADVYIPTSFSPNGDGINDVFIPFGNDFEVQELAIFDRWGGLLHKGMDWDGGKAGQGVYVYKLTYLDLLTLKKEVLQGEVTLVK